MAQNNAPLKNILPSRYERNNQKAKQLLTRFQKGDEKARSQFEQDHPEGKNENFQPTLLDARMVISRQTVILQKLELPRLKKQAKKLLKQCQALEPSSLKRISEHHPQQTPPKAEDLKLADCQLVIAREIGLPSWSKLKHHIETIDQISSSLLKKTTTPQTPIDPSTLHIRCGTDIKYALPKAGFSGTFFELQEVFVVGCLKGGADKNSVAFIKNRAKFLSETFSDMPPPPDSINHDMSYESVFKGLQEDRKTLTQLIEQHDTICLWFEHDSHDQLILAYLLHFMQDKIERKTVEIISPHQFPGLEHFLGLGQLGNHPQTLPLLWEQRSPITKEQLSEGCKIWEALCNSDPTTLKNMTQQKRALPHMPEALLWHINNLPDQTSGLSMIEENTLKILERDGDMFLGKLFHFYTYEADPLPTLGDLVYFDIVHKLMNVNKPAIRYKTFTADAPPHKRGKLELTQTGKELLQGKYNWLELNPIHRWVGGIEIKTGKPNWWRKENAELIYK